MKRSQAVEPVEFEPAFNVGLIKAATTLTGAGLMLAAVGMALAAAAVTRGAMVWTRQREISPAALAAERLDRFRHVTMAGRDAWREHAAASPTGGRLCGHWGGH